ncbi:MAG TPA: hypothetical protein VFB06_12345 [Streptosporangiaceae bacterium]|nr:hypothetical protein [Streptosporangiaceae bacterium]
MTIDDLENSLSEMLHRLTPEPPRTVTVEDVAIHLANQAAPRRVPRTERAFGDGQTAVLHIGKRGRPRFAPALAAASVIAIVGASTGIAVALTSSHHTAKAPASGGGNTSANATTFASTPGTDDTTPSGTGGAHRPQQAVPIAGSLWGGKLIVQQSLDPGTLTSGGDSLYALSGGNLIRIDPAKRQIVGQTSVPGTGRPVVDGNQVWVASPSGSGMTLSAFDATTLNPAGTVAVPGSLAQPQGALALGPGGDLYVAAGSNVAVVDPGSHSVIRHISVSGGQADSVTITPDGRTLYAGVTGGGGFRLEAFNAATGASLGGSTMPGTGNGGYLLATNGGVWGTTGSLMTQRVWFAPGGDLTKVRSVTSGVDGGLDSAPTYVNGVVWIGGIQSLKCLDPASGKVLAGSPIPADRGVPEHFGSVAFVAGHAYTAFQDQRAQQVGVAAVIPPAACGAAGTTGS